MRYAALPLPDKGSATTSERPLPPLIGREAEIALLLDPLTPDHAQLVTLLGPGGVGKTRLALHMWPRE